MSTKRPVTGREGETRLADGAVVTFQRRGVFSSSEASALFRDIMANTAWKREMLTVYGAEVCTRAPPDAPAAPRALPASRRAGPSGAKVVFEPAGALTPRHLRLPLRPPRSTW
jgi:hypothetical protein